MKIARLLAGIALLGWASLGATDSPPVPFIIGGDEVIDPSLVENDTPLMLPEEPELPALDEPILVDDSTGALDLGMLDEELVFEEPQDIIFEQPEVSAPADPVVELADPEMNLSAGDATALPFVLDELDAGLPLDVDVELPELSVEDPAPVEPVWDDLPALDIAMQPEEVEEEQPTMILTPDMAISDEELSMDDQIAFFDTEPMAEGDVSMPEFSDDEFISIDPSIEDNFSDFQNETLVETPVFDENAPVGVKTMQGQQEEWGAAYEVSVPPRRLIGPDGSEHIEGLENVIGQSNPVLGEVRGIRRSVAEVGQGFPALNVEQMSLTDLLYYLSNFTNKRLNTSLTEPVYVSMDFQPKSLDDVFEYLKQNYPIDTVVTNESIMVVPARTMVAENIEAVEPIVADGSALLPAVGSGDIVAYDANGNPIMAGDTLDNLMAQNSTAQKSFAENIEAVDPGLVTSSVGVEESVMPDVPVSPIVAMPEGNVLSKTLANPMYAQAAQNGTLTDANGMMITQSMWQDMQRKAHLYDLNRRRELLLAQREQIERNIRDYKLARRTD